MRVTTNNFLLFAIGMIRYLVCDTGATQKFTLEIKLRNPLIIQCRCAESNRRPIDYESIALPTELQRHAKNCSLTLNAISIEQRMGVKTPMRCICGLMLAGCHKTNFWVTFLRHG